MAKKIDIDYIKSFRLCDENHFLIMKGIAIFLVMVAYVSVAYFQTYVLAQLAGVGSIIFLFCSGYGLSESFLWKKGLPHYWENKIVKVWIPSLVSLIIISLLNGGTGITWVEQSPIGLSGWFLHMLFACYLLFWLVFQYVEGKATPVAILFAAAAIAFASIEQQTYAEVLAAFPLGVLVSQLGLKRKLRELGLKGRLLVCALLLAAAVGGYVLATGFDSGWICNLCWLVSKTAMACFLIYGVFCLQKIPVFGLFGLLGTLSYAIYLLKNVLSLICQPGDWETVGIGLAVLVVAASVYSWLFTQLHLWNKRVRRKKNPPLKGSMQR